MVVSLLIMREFQKSISGLTDLWIHLIEKDRNIFLSNFTNDLSYFLEFMNPISLFLYAKISVRPKGLALAL